MRSFRIPIALLALALVSSSVLRAQATPEEDQVPEEGTDFGNLTTPELVTEAVGALGLLPGAEPKVTFYFTPSAVDVDGAPIAGLMFGGSYKQVQLDLRYQNIGSADGSTDFDQFRLRGKYVVPEESLPDQLGLAFLGQYVDTREASTSTTWLVIASWELSAAPTNLQVYGNLGWAEKKPDGRKAIRDAVRVVGVGFNVGVVEIGLDYTFENDITKGEDDYTLTASHKIGAGKLSFGAGKEGVVFASFRISFQR